MKIIEGNIIDIHKRKIFKGRLEINDNKIINIKEKVTDSNCYILPGFIDSHMHIESTMLIPSEFAKLAVSNGTVAVIADPHEIANVMGCKGVDFMIENAKKVPLKTYFAIPSCVPVSKNEFSGAEINSTDIDNLFQKHNLHILGEVMDYEGILKNEKQIFDKIETAKKYNALIDGHAPGLTLEENYKYAESGISTDHECSNIEEAINKLIARMKIQIREGSAAQNFEALYPLLEKYNEEIMLCTDDSHPDDLLEKGHINKIIAKGLKMGVNLFDLLQATTLNPQKHYRLDVGMLKPGDNADFVIIDNLENFNVLETYINGKAVYSNGRVLFDSKKEKAINNFKIKEIDIEDIQIKKEANYINVIEVIDKELLTNSFTTRAKTDKNNNLISDIDKDILKIVVVNRYKKQKATIGFINGIGLRKGAIATSISHDSHNIIAVGTDDLSILNAINEIISKKGGITYVNEKNYYTIELEFAGLMTQDSAENVANKYKELNNIVKANGIKLTSPFMTLSFMSLLVIPKLKISAKGLFDVEKMKFINLFSEK